MDSATKVTARKVSREEYDENLQGYIYSLFLLSEFVESIGTGGKAHYFHFLRDGQVIGKIAGISEDGTRFMGKYLLTYAGPALINQSETLYNECLVALKKCSRHHNFSRLTIFYYDQQYQFRCNAKGYFIRTNREFIRHFDQDEEPLKFSKSLMFNFRKASKLNPIFREETSERVLAKLHELLMITWTIRDAKFNGQYLPYPYKHLTKEAVNRMFHTGILKLYYIEVEGEIHCVRCAISRDKRMYGIIIAGDEFSYKNGLQHYLQHELITRLFNEGYNYYNISVVDFDEEGLVNYKESLGCKLHKVHGAYTHFIKFPQALVNPLMNAGQVLSRYRYLSKVVTFASRHIVGKDL